MWDYFSKTLTALHVRGELNFSLVDLSYAISFSKLAKTSVYGWLTHAHILMTG